MSDQIADRTIKRQELQTSLGVGSECVRRWIKAKKIPAPDVAISRRTLAWRLSTLKAAGVNIA